MDKQKERRRRVRHSDAPLRKHRLVSFKGGWFLGNFQPSLQRTQRCEVGYKVHAQGDVWPAHYQKTAWEYNLLVYGHLQIGRQHFYGGDLFVVPPTRVVKPLFHSRCEVVVVKIPSIPGDKVCVS